MLPTFLLLQNAPGDFGDIEAGPDGRAEFRFVNDRLKIWEMIGRSMIIHNCSSNVAHLRNTGNDERCVSLVFLNHL